MKILVLPKNDLYRQAAALFAETADRAIREKGLFTVTLSGGSTPKALYSLLARDYADSIDWKQTQVFFSDERCVPPDHIDSNFRTANETLLSKVDIPPGNVHRMKGEIELAAAADDYASELTEVLGAEGTPQFDLMLLGIGEDAHTASIFPGSELVREEAKTVAAAFVPKLNQHRLTLTLPVLKNARRTVVLAIGPGKAEAVNHAIEGAYEPETYPAQLLRNASGEVIWMLDPQAASSLANQTT